MPPIRRDANRSQFLLLLAAFVVCWTLYQIVSHGAGDLHNDMAEAYAWGQEMQGGYFKHPPFWAWLTYGWFSIFPRADWAAYLLCVLNAVLGMYFVTRCAAYFVSDARLQAIAGLLLIFIPAYTFHGMKMNANTIHLSVWPAIVWAFLRVMQRGGAGPAMLVGLLASFTVLSKYNAVLFLFCILVASLLHPDAKRFWKSPLPVFVVLAGLPLTAFHAGWLWRNDFLPIGYFSALRGLPPWESFVGGARFLASQILFALPAVAILLVVGAAFGVRLRKSLALNAMDRVLLVLALGPPLLSTALCAGLSTACLPLWGLQNLFLVPTLVLRFVELPDPAGLWRRITQIVAGFLAVMLIAAPAVAWVNFKRGLREAVDPRSEVALILTRWWRETYGRPWRIVGGDESYALAASFYSPDHPSYFIVYPRPHTPWITDERLDEEGALIVCNELDDICEQSAAVAGAAPGTEGPITAVKAFLGLRGQDRDFKFFVIPPGTWRKKGSAP